MNFDRIARRVYFYSGISFSIYGFLGLFLPIPEALSVQWQLQTMIAGLVLTQIGITLTYKPMTIRSRVFTRTWESNTKFDNIRRLPPCGFQTRSWKREDGIVEGRAIRDGEYAIEI